MPDGRAATQAFSVVTLSPPMAASLPGARVILAVIGSPASSVAVTSSGESFPSAAFCSRVAGASMRAQADSPYRAVSSACSWDGELPVTAWISLASSASRMPSLSVVHTPPSRRRNDAPADSSPPKPTDPSSRPGTNHLKPTGTSTSCRPSPPTTRSIRDDDTSVLPTATSAPHSGRRSEEHTSELQSRQYLVCRLLLDKKKYKFLLLGGEAAERQHHEQAHGPEPVVDRPSRAPSHRSHSVDEHAHPDRQITRLHSSFSK